MSQIDKIRKAKTDADQKFDNYITNAGIVSSGFKNVAAAYDNAESILDDIDAEFRRETGLDVSDVAFLFLAVAIQVVRQYVLTPFEQRLGDQEAAKQTPGHAKEHSNRKHHYYRPTLEEVISNPVPFDANNQTEYAKGWLKGSGKMGHRLTPGHDPILGWIFGTANIATSTITRWDFKSKHVISKKVCRKEKEFLQDFIDKNASLERILYYTKEALFNQGIEGKTLIAASLGKEYVHLKSDIGTKNSLPFPIVSTISTDVANFLSDYGVDMANISVVFRQAALAQTINMLISMMHGFKFILSYGGRQPSEEEIKINQVKTRKILLLSNLIASSSNVVLVLATAEASGGESVKYLDVGGLAVSLYRLIADTAVIRRIEREYIINHWNDRILNHELQLLLGG